MSRSFIIGVLFGIALVYLAVVLYGRLTRCDCPMPGTIRQVEVNGVVWRGTACDTMPYACVRNAKRVKP